MIPSMHELIRGKSPNELGWIGGVTCPFHDDENPSASINVGARRLYCHACHTSYSFEDGMMAVEHDPFQTLDKEINGTEPDEAIDVYYQRDKFPSFMYQRGFDDATMRRWELGTINVNDLFIPIRNSTGKLVSWQIRQAEGEPKYKLKPGVKVHNLLFGFDKWAQGEHSTLYVCEGALDAIWLDQCGFEAVATLGSSISPVQVNLLLRSGFHSIVTVADNDEAGFDFGLKIRRALRSKIPFVGYVKIPRPYNDIQDVRDISQARRILTNICV